MVDMYDVSPNYNHNLNVIIGYYTITLNDSF